MFSQTISTFIKEVTAFAEKHSKKVKMSGNEKTETHQLTPFNKVQLEIPAVAEVVTGTGVAKVLIVADENLHRYIDVSVTGGSLVLAKTEDVNFPKGQVRIMIHAPGQLVHTGVFGSGEIKFVLENAEQVTGRVMGSGCISMEGSVKNFIGSVNGSGSLNTVKLKAEYVRIEVVGSGTVEVSPVVELDASVLGSGKVSYNGNPKVKATKTGSGEVVQLNQKFNHN